MHIRDDANVEIWFLYNCFSCFWPAAFLNPCCRLIFFLVPWWFLIAYLWDAFSMLIWGGKSLEFYFSKQIQNAYPFSPLIKLLGFRLYDGKCYPMNKLNPLSTINSTLSRLYKTIFVVWHDEKLSFFSCRWYNSTWNIHTNLLVDSFLLNWAYILVCILALTRYDLKHIQRPHAYSFMLKKLFFLLMIKRIVCPINVKINLSPICKDEEMC